MCVSIHVLVCVWMDDDAKTRVVTRAWWWQKNIEIDLNRERERPHSRNEREVLSCLVWDNLVVVYTQSIIQNSHGRNPGIWDIVFI